MSTRENPRYASVGTAAVETMPGNGRLRGIFAPRSVAVVGAMPTPGTVPYDIFHNILTCGYRGTLFPVAPNKANICSIRAYRYVTDIPDEVDLAVIVYPSHVVDRALEDCGRKGIRSAVIISAGFRETGARGAALEQRVKEICRQYDIALIGPNCLGVINTDPEVMLNASFARKMPDEGRIAFLSQSGALCTAVLDYARDKHIGFSKFISFGNKAGVSEVELLDYLRADPLTDIILLYLEEVADGRALVEAARRVTRGPGAKPILAIKAGRTPEGASAAASHTGSLASEDAICDDLLAEGGIIRVNSIEEMFNAAIMYAHQPVAAGERLAIVTNGGGPGVMATDAAVRVGLSITRFEPGTTAKLKGSLPAAANVSNPVDVIGDARADRYVSALSAVLADPNVDQVLVILTPQSMTDIEAIAKAVCGVHEEATKPLSCAFMGAADVAVGVRLLHAANVPHYILPEWACRAMADVQRIRRWQQQQPGLLLAPVVDHLSARLILEQCPAGYLREDQSLDVLRAYGLPVPPARLCRDAEEAVAFAGHVGYPVAAFVVSPQVVHKSDVGGVALNLGDADALREACHHIYHRVRENVADCQIDGILVRPMIPAGTEIILGAKRDPAFGPIVMCGLGGIYVEMFKDIAFGSAPLDDQRAAGMLRRVRAFRLLSGARGAEPADIREIEQSLIRLGQLMVDFPGIAEVDINPMIAGPASAGNAVADARIRVSGPSEASPSRAG